MASLLLSCTAILLGQTDVGVPKLLTTENLRTIGTNTTEVFSVAPYVFYATPYSNRPSVLEVTMVPPRGLGKLPDQIIVTTSELQGAATVALPLVKLPTQEGEEPEFRTVRLRLRH